MLDFRIVSTALTITAISFPVIANDRLGPFVAKEQSVRSRDFDQRHFRIELDLDWDAEAFDGRVVHELAPFQAVDTIEFDAVEMEIKNVHLLTAGEDAAGGDDGEPNSSQNLEFQHKGGVLTIDLPKEAPPNELIRIAITYRVVKPKHGGHFVVPDAHEPDQPKVFWTQSESIYARHWYPCHDSPADRVTSETIVTVPEAFFVLSNGTLKQTSKPDNGRRTFHWTQKKTHAPYLVSVVAGEFDALEQDWDGIPVVSYVPKGRLDEAKRSFEKTPEMLKLFSEKIGYRYPWPKYTQICVDEYSWGGMEHTSATTLSLRTLHDERAELDRQSIDLVAHELAHQWWGDLITCKDWAEIWLNESFATYFEAVWAEHDLGMDEATWKRHEDATSYMEEDQKRYRRPIVTYRYPRPDAMFDSHSYPKGSCVLHMLRFVLGDRQFWNGLQRYAYNNQFGVAETSDLRTSFEEATGQGLNWFFNQWVHHGGHPEYEVDYSYDRIAKVVRMTVKQTQMTDDLTPLFRMPVEIEIVMPNKTILRRVTVDKASETFSFDAPERPRRVLFDPNEWILKELSFKKSKQELLDQLRDDGHVMCRARAVNGLKEFESDAEVRDALIAAAENDTFWAIRREAVNALKKFSGDPVRDALLAIVKSDEKSKVRRAAVLALEEFPHADTKSLLRQVIAADRSYYVVADALKVLAEIDDQDAIPDLRAALSTPSDNEVILEAAADALAKVGDDASLDTLVAMLDPPSPAARRSAVLGAIGKLGGDQEKVLDLLADQLKSDRQSYRMSAVRAIGASGEPKMIPIILKQKENETSRRARQTIDDAVKQLRENSGEQKLRIRIEKLEREQKRLKEELQSTRESKG